MVVDFPAVPGLCSLEVGGGRHFDGVEFLDVALLGSGVDDKRAHVDEGRVEIVCKGDVDRVEVLGQRAESEVGERAFEQRREQENEQTGHDHEQRDHLRQVAHHNGERHVRDSARYERFGVKCQCEGADERGKNKPVLLLVKETQQMDVELVRERGGPDEQQLRRRPVCRLHFLERQRVLEQREPVLDAGLRPARDGNKGLEHLAEAQRQVKRFENCRRGAVKCCLFVFEDRRSREILRAVAEPEKRVAGKGVLVEVVVAWNQPFEQRRLRVKFERRKKPVAALHQQVDRRQTQQDLGHSRQSLVGSCACKNDYAVENGRRQHAEQRKRRNAVRDQGLAAIPRDPCLVRLLDNGVCKRIKQPFHQPRRLEMVGRGSALRRSDDRD
ncbi:hypothetical protein KL930_001188 [Ogataea haglerorum]|uniref:Uncharacterized protein n=2 Tax=Ogataea haglerorum TaxID=1937702 RepID=A0ABQ7RFX4_9ASCO|nr:hypothetical protein KL914_003085 [Ogataea haglerorum]KAG7708097.1 hypothetical protein KL950_002723 [Ogataea haglerorum]KAG7714856.1 hypothetical protein KL913_004177 [Ogataea haglerorum]KAG7719508.1 hypothetical protein KL949_002500 [Ogataea haglerorum]KAG7738055.1 hypothetical protein KL923_003602 [Ogataea haglerorum]